MTQKPFKSKTEKANNILEHVHSDLFKLPVASYHKFKWAMMLLDEFSHFTFVVLLQHKSEAPIKMIELITLVENQTKSTIK